MKRIGIDLFAFVVAFPVILTSSLLAQPAGQWDFNSGSLVSTLPAGQPLQYADGSGGATETGTSFGTTTSFGIPDINGTPAQVMRFPAATNGAGYLMPTPVNANGGGTLLNEYTIIFDVLYPQAANAKLRPLLDTDASFYVRGPELVVSAGNGIGITPSGPFSGTIASNTWYRLGFVVVQDQNSVIEYINGVKVGVNTISGSGQTGADGRFALSLASTALLLGNASTNAAPGYVNSIQIRAVALNSGQMKAVGGPSADGILQTIPPVPSFIDSRTPDVNATGVLPNPTLRVVLHQGDTIIDGSSIKLSFDGAIVPATVTPTVPTYAITYAVPNLLDASTTHGVQLVYQDSVAGFNTNAWSFTVVDYPSITLPAPFAFEDFDGVAEAALPAGWSVTNRTSIDTAGFDLADPTSDAYLDWVVISTNTLQTAKGDDPLIVPPIVVNGVLLTAMANNQLVYAESDSRGDNQVQDLFSPDFDCTGKTNVYLSFHSIYQQNQDSLGAVEYSTDQGATWLPALYMLQCCIDGQDGVADVHRLADGTIDAVASLTTFVDGGAAWGTNYGAFIGAPVTQALAPFISPRVNDDNRESIRVEVLRLAGADGRPNVRLRFIQTGTGSWWFGIDDVGLYTINTPVIRTQPQSQTVDAGTPVTFSVAADSITPLSYQWKFQGTNIVGATSSSYTIANVTPANEGQYRVVVSNSDGPTPSNPAALTVNTVPHISTQPLSQVADPNSTVTFTVVASGGRPLNYQWLSGTTPAGANTNTLTLNNVQTGDSGNYTVVVSNSFNSVTSTVARLTVYSAVITNSLVVHLPFDGGYNDTSGRANNASAVGSPGFAPGKIGQAFQFTTREDGSGFNYATLGYPDDLKFADTSDFAISFWVNYNQQGDDPPFISNKNWDSSDNRGWGVFTQGGGNFRINVTGTGGTKMSTTYANTVRDGTWHNIVASFVRGGFVYTYLDGQLVTTTPLLTTGTVDTDAINWTRTLSSGLASGPHSVNIGQDGTGAYTDCNGTNCPADGSAGITNALIDDVGIWRRAITPNEAASIFSQGQRGEDLTTASGAPVVLPPTIATQPVSETVNAGSEVTFSVIAGGTAPFTYDWRKAVTNSLGVVGTNLTLTAVTPAAAGDYTVIVGNAGGSITSQVARLSVFTGTVSQDLVAHLKFDGDYTDSSGRGNNAAAVGSPGFAAGKIGQAFHFTSKADGSDFSYATLGYPTDLQFDTNDFSMSFWVNYTIATADPAFIGNKNWDSSSNIGWGLFHQDPTDYLRVSCTGTPRGSANRMNATLSGPTLGDGTWHYVAVSFWRGQFAYIYVDGALVNATPLTITGSVDTAGQTWTRGTNSGTFSVNIGQEGTGTYVDNSGGITGGDAGIEALIDDVGIWRRVVTPQEAAAVFAAGAAGSDLSHAVVGPPTLGEITVSASATTLNFIWTGGVGIRLQKSTSLTNPNWQDVLGSAGSSSASEPIGVGDAFYRLFKP
jgi:hypothetical protein